MQEFKQKDYGGNCLTMGVDRRQNMNVVFLSTPTSHSVLNGMDRDGWFSLGFLNSISASDNRDVKFEDSLVKEIFDEVKLCHRESGNDASLPGKRLLSLSAELNNNIKNGVKSHKPKAFRHRGKVCVTESNGYRRVVVWEEVGSGDQVEDPRKAGLSYSTRLAETDLLVLMADTTGSANSSRLLDFVRDYWSGFFPLLLVSLNAGKTDGVEAASVKFVHKENARLCSIFSKVELLELGPADTAELVGKVFSTAVGLLTRLGAGPGSFINQNNFRNIL